MKKATKNGAVLAMAVLIAALVFSTGCDEEGSGALSPEAIVAGIEQEGLTCAVQESMESLEGLKREELRSMLLVRYTPEEFGHIILSADNCNSFAEENGKPRIIQSESALGVGPMVVETIEYTPILLNAVPTSSIVNDGAWIGWMCGQDPGSPPDKIFQYNYILKAYVNSPNLRYRSYDDFGACLATTNLFSFPARVYADNSIRMCVGYTRYNLCTYIGNPTLGSLRVKGNP